MVGCLNSRRDSGGEHELAMSSFLKKEDTTRTVRIGNTAHVTRCFTLYNGISAKFMLLWSRVRLWPGVVAIAHSSHQVHQVNL